MQILLVGFTWDGHLDGDGNQERIIPYLDWLGVIFATVPLQWDGWLFCFLVGIGGFTWGFLLRFIPVPAEKNYKGDLFTDEEEDPEQEKQLLLNH